MNTTKKLPIGIEDFEELRREDFYYVDKTGLIRELFENWGKVNLFTRPRRFGKSLNMNMLKYFFEYGCDGALFEGLAVSGERELCEKYMGRFPVISITLKGAVGGSYEAARAMLASVIGQEALRFSFLEESPRLSEREKRRYAQLVNVDASGRQGFIMPDEVLGNSLLTLSHLLCRHYGQRVILFIDEYDVPLDKARQHGYYEEMLGLVRDMLGQALKSNENLYFAVLTGCLRVAKESVFTGLNNLQVMTITDSRFDSCFGFTDREVKEMLEFYGFGDKYGLVKEWYDGYRFGNTDVYCPWDVINYCAQLRADGTAQPRAYWVNTSGNDIIRTFLAMAKGGARREIEELVNGGTVAKKVNEELTYRDLYKNVENLWSMLLATGYLTRRSGEEGGVYRLAIPNLEIRQIFIDQVMEWMQEEARKDAPGMDAFCEAFLQGDAAEIEKRLSAYLQKTISVRDAGARSGKKENFYHGMLLGLLSHWESWYMVSNGESGEGFGDILIEMEEARIGIVIEVKYVEEGGLEAGCQKALAQITEKGYETRLWQDEMTTIFKYGIACRKKSCAVRVEKEEHVERHS